MRPNSTFRFLKNNQVAPNPASLIQCYQPIIGSQPLALYDYLLHFWDNGRADHRFSEILNHLDIGMGVLTEGLDVLGAMKLLELYQEGQTYLIKVLPALDRELFLTNAVYRHLLATKIGEPAVKDLLVQPLTGAKSLTKSFSEVFQLDGQLPSRQAKPSSFDLDSFKRLMTQDGLRFADEASDVVALYHLSDRRQLTWFETYQLAKQTAINGQLSLERLITLDEGRQTASLAMPLTDQEKTTLKTVRSHSARDFLNLMKQSRKALVTDKEKKLLTQLAEQGFLDEVINLMVLYTLQRTQSGNLNQVFIQKLANDLGYKGIKTAEETLTYLRGQGKPKGGGSKSQSATGSTKTNVPTWSNQDYKNETSQEEQDRLEAYKRQRLAELNKED